MDDNTQVQQPIGQMSRPIAPPVPRQQVSATENVQSQQVHQTPSSPPQAVQDEDDDTQQVAVSAGHPEQGPIAVVESNDEDEDEQQVSPQEVKVQSTHPKEVVLPKELKDAGVEQSDAKEVELEEQMEEANVILGSEVTPAAPTVPVSSLPMSYEEVLQTQKTNSEVKNPYNSLAWKISELLREWKKQLLSST